MGRFSAFVLAAGYGTRLRPLTDEIPKPLLPVGEEPLLLSTLRALHEGGAGELWINVHHMHEKIISVVEQLSFKVHVSYEHRILGTAGGLAAIRGRVRAPLVVINGDIVTELPLEVLLAQADLGLTLAVAPPTNSPGTVGIGDRGQVVRLRGEVFGQEVEAVDYMGVACVGLDCLATLPGEGCLIGDWALPHLRAGGSIGTARAEGPFRDLGDPQTYLEVNLAWLAGRSHVGAGVSVPFGIELERSVIGPRARLSGSGLIRDSLVLPGASAIAPLHRSIVLPSGRVVTVE